ncbi:hypothetical protein DPMN_080441 [Dreissena polymorpha]|uniref:HTH psq-type domain-containing protein n=1 Tax=Dreissena polymorpha TaxID=45954 RepID=A0A9D3YVM5_DREPO|nr:hypothetical protein DPMN_080441 [Dreissena polymorpha]
MSELPSKRLRVVLVLEEKTQTNKRVRDVNKPTVKMLSEKYRVRKSTIGDIVRKKSAYMFFSVKRN